ncbi:MAG: hypothetical protein DMF23_10100 [Verrucomicrobia bacterium]|nr:MAG: hypothetical protein DMF23_10100 [Verrucomicrobiota bacterium]
MYDPGQKECLLVKLQLGQTQAKKRPLSNLFEYLIRHSQLRVSSAKSGAVAIVFGLAKVHLGAFLIDRCRATGRLDSMKCT